MMRRASALFLCLVCLACATNARDQYLAAEASFLRFGVDRKVEESEVRRVLAQRKLDVVAVVNGPHFSALGAESRDGRVTALRVISDRGVVLAQDAVLDDLFAPGRVRLLKELAPELDEMEVVAFAREELGAGAGCVSLKRVLADGQLVDVVLDVGLFGPRACVVSIAHGGRNKLAAAIGFPGLSLGVIPAFGIEFQLRPLLLGRPDPGVRVAKPLETSGRLQAARDGLSAASCTNASFAERHALGVARAAISMFLGESKGRQIAAYRECAGAVKPSSSEAESLAEAVGYIERGFSDPVAARDAEKNEPVDTDAVVVEPNAP